MKPLIWVNAEGFGPDGYAIFKNAERSTNSYIFMSGKTLPHEDVGGLKYSTDPKDYDLIYSYKHSEERLKQFDYLANTGQAPLVNQKVLDILNRLCPDDIQAFPVTIIPEKGSNHTFENQDYFLINITKLVDAIDLEKSEVDFFKEEGVQDQICHISKLVFVDKQDFDKPLIARITNDNALKIVSPHLAQAFTEAGITGVEFVEDKDYC